MYYAVLRKEIVVPGYCGGTLTRRVGGVYEVKSHYDEVYGMYTVKYRCMDLMADTPEAYGPWEEMSVNSAREHFTEAKQDLNAVIEQSFLVCEAAYC